MVGTCEGEASASLERGTIQTRMTSSDERKARGANRLSETLGSIVEAGRVVAAPVGSTPCSSEMTSQNLAPIWLPH